MSLISRQTQGCEQCCDTAGPATPATRVYLSPATLVVVPAPLIGHWMHQLATHTRGGLLRVAVLGEVSSGSRVISGSGSPAFDQSLRSSTLGRDPVPAATTCALAALCTQRRLLHDSRTSL